MIDPRQVWQNSSARFLGLAAALLALMTVSQFIPLLGVWPSVALVLATTAISPAYGLGLGIFIAPIQQFVTFGPAEIHLLHGICWSFIGIRMATLCSFRDFSGLRKIARSPVGLFIAFFMLLVIIHNGNSFLSKYFLLDVGFAATIFLIAAAIIMADKLPAHLPTIVVTAILAAGFFSIAFDAILNYVPISELGPPAAEMPPDKLRLGGLHSNPNATAKFILAMQAIVGAALFQRGAARMDRKRAGTWLLYCVVTLALAATASKSAIVAFPLALIGLAVLSISKDTSNRLQPGISLKSIGAGAAKVIGLFVLVLAIWAVVIAPTVKRRAAIEWLNSGKAGSRSDLVVLAGPGAPVSGAAAAGGQSRPPMPARNLADIFSQELRIGQSSQLRAEGVAGDLSDPFKSTPKGETWVNRDCGIACTGQRDLLWAAGWQTVRDNWLWGIGYGSWKKELFDKLRFPFDSPHSGFLELWGEFGVAGAVIYIALAIFIAVRARRVALFPVNSEQKPFIVACSLFAISILVTELFEGTKFFAMSPHAIWIWALLALQERSIDEARFCRLAQVPG
jgi:O-Antigen ligase